MERTLVNKYLTAHIIVLDISKGIDMASQLLVCYFCRGTTRGVISEHLKKDSYLDWFANIILKAIFNS